LDPVILIVAVPPELPPLPVKAIFPFALIVPVLIVVKLLVASIVSVPLTVSVLPEEIVTVTLPISPELILRLLKVIDPVTVEVVAVPIVAVPELLLNVPPE
jgi:hypothetical protein